MAQAALRDLKTLISNVNSGARFPGRREDFDSDDAYIAWRKTELDTLQQLILALASVNRDALASDESSKERAPLSTRPSSMAFSASNLHLSIGNGLSSSVSNPAGTPLSPATPGGWTHIRTPSLSSHRSSQPLNQFDYFAESSANEEEEETLSIHQYVEDQSSTLNSAESPAAGFDLVYVPPNPRSYYAFLLHTCLTIDLETLKDLPPDEEVSLKILSKPHQVILSECAIRWRLSPQTRAVIFLDEIIRRFVAEEIPVVECVDEALFELDGIIESTGELGWDSLMLVDRQMLASCLFDMFDLILRRYSQLLQVPSTDSMAEISGLQRTLSLVAYHPVFREDAAPTQDYASKVDALAQGIQEVALRSYQVIRVDVLYKEKDGQSYIKAMKDVLKWFKGLVMIVDKLFPDPILE